MEQKKLTSAQKHRIFEKRMGEMLFPHGFFLKDHRFYKIIPEEVVIMVGLHLAAYSDPRIVFGTVPFCVGAELLWQETNLFDEVNRWSDDEWSYGRPFEQVLDIEFDTFEQRFFEHLISIRSVHDLYPFRVYLENMACRNPKPLYYLAEQYDFEVAIRTQNYDVAMERLLRRYEQGKELEKSRCRILEDTLKFARWVKENADSDKLSAWATAEMKKLKKVAEKALTEKKDSEYVEELCFIINQLQFISKGIDVQTLITDEEWVVSEVNARTGRYERWIHQLETGDYAELNQMIESAIEKSTQIYKEMFGKYYPAE